MWVSTLLKPSDSIFISQKNSTLAESFLQLQKMVWKTAIFMRNTLYDARRASIYCSTKVIKPTYTVFENHTKNRIRSRSKILSRQKFIKKWQKRCIWRIFENLKLTVKQCCQTGQFYLEKIVVKCLNWNTNATFCVIFKHCAVCDTAHTIIAKD